MSAYGDKSLEETRGIIEVFLRHHKERTGTDPNPLKLMEELKALKSQKVKENFESIFGTLSPKSLEHCIQALSDHMKESQPQKPPVDQKPAESILNKAKSTILPGTKR